MCVHAYTLCVHTEKIHADIFTNLDKMNALFLQNYKMSKLAK